MDNEKREGTGCWEFRERLDGKRQLFFITSVESRISVANIWKEPLWCGGEKARFPQELDDDIFIKLIYSILHSQKS